MMTKKKIFAGMMAVAMAAVTMASVLPVKAAAKPESIQIEGAKTVQTGKTIELDSEIFPDDDLVNDWNIVWKSNKPSVAKVMFKRGDSTKIKGKKAGTVKITVKIKGTNLKAVHKIQVKDAATDQSVSADQKKLEKYKKEIKKIKKEIKNVSVSPDAAQRSKQYLALKKKLQAVDAKLDVLDDKWDDRRGKTARKMENAIDQVEDRLDLAEDFLEHKFGVDD